MVMVKFEMLLKIKIVLFLNNFVFILKTYVNPKQYTGLQINIIFLF